MSEQDQTGGSTAPTDARTDASSDAQTDVQTGGSSSDVHNLGGDLGPASVRASSARDGGGLAQDAAAGAGYAQDLGPMSGRDEEQPAVAGSDESGYAAPMAPPVVAGAPSLVVDIDEGGDNLGRGADGDTAARLEQKQNSGL
jgi:hypothetical protein